MLVGGLSGSQQEEKKVRRLSFETYASSIVEPMCEIFFLDTPALGIDLILQNFLIQDLDQ